MEYRWYGHGTIRVATWGHIFFFDPVRSNRLLGTTLRPSVEGIADAIFLTSSDVARCHPPTVRELTDGRTALYAPPRVIWQLAKERIEAGKFVPIEGRQRLLETEHGLEVWGFPVSDDEEERVVYYIAGLERLLLSGDTFVDQERWRAFAVPGSPEVAFIPAAAWRKNLPRAGEMIDFLRHCPGVVCVPTAYHSTPQGDPHTRIDQSQLLGLFPCDLEVRLVPRENTLETTHPVVALLPEKL